jgi:hypothetical protein
VRRRGIDSYRKTDRIVGEGRINIGVYCKSTSGNAKSDGACRAHTSIKGDGDRQRADNRQQIESGQRTAGSRQQAAGSRQQAAGRGSRQQAAGEVC